MKPWKVEQWYIGEARRPVLTIVSDTDRIAEVSSLYPDRPTEQAANACLIAAAPDMLAALCSALASWDCMDQPRNRSLALELIRAAIAKAEGNP